jgi:predicted HicB family RNase H-like nuclease
MSDVARIHCEIPDELHRKAKSAAALAGITLKDFVEQALADAVRKSEGAKR